jgi:hypothetical protein
VLPVLADGTGLGVLATVGVDALPVGSAVLDGLSSPEQANNVTEVTITIATMMHLTIWNLLKESSHLERDPLKQSSRSRTPLTKTKHRQQLPMLDRIPPPHPPAFDYSGWLRSYLYVNRRPKSIPEIQYFRGFTKTVTSYP